MLKNYHTHKENGFAHAVVIISLVVVLIGALGFIFWQNFIHKDDSNQSNIATEQDAKTPDSQQSLSPDSTTEPTGQDATPKKPVDKTKYVTIGIWNVKFKAPTNGTTVKWAAFNGSNNDLGFSTSNLTDTNGICNAENGAAGILSRSTKPMRKNFIGTTVTLINNNKPVDGYYYAFGFPNGQSCDDQNPSDYEEAQLLQKLTQSLVAK